jgi:hypothetical protein
MTRKATRKFSAAQMAYMVARATFEVADSDCRANSREIDAECERLGLEFPYGILPEDHPLMVEGQRLLDIYNAALNLMREAAGAMFDWSLTTTFAKHGTAEQQKTIREGVERVKKMAHVEKFHQQMVDLSLKLVA